MYIGATLHVDGDTAIAAYVLDVPNQGPRMYVEIGKYDAQATFIISDPAFLPRLALALGALDKEYRAALTAASQAADPADRPASTSGGCDVLSAQTPGPAGH